MTTGAPKYPLLFFWPVLIVAPSRPSRISQGNLGVDLLAIPDFSGGAALLMPLTFHRCMTQEFPALNMVTRHIFLHDPRVGEGCDNREGRAVSIRDNPQVSNIKKAMVSKTA